MRRSARQMMRALTTCVLVLCAAQAARAQLDENCTVSVLNRTVRVNPDGTWVLPNIPANFGQIKARATCVRNGVTTSGESEFFTIPSNGSVNIPAIVLGAASKVPSSLTVAPATVSLTAAGQTAQLVVTAHYPDNTTKDVSAGAAGTNYTTSNPAFATVGPDGLVTAVASGAVVIQATNDGASAIITANVTVAGNDSDGDGIPDADETRLGLDPRNPVDAQEDFDRDDLTNLREFQLGTNIRKRDTDEDGLPDGQEVDQLRTNPLLADTDGDGVPDGVEAQTGSNPLDPGTFDLSKALRSIEVTPSQFTLVVNTIIGEASQQLSVTGRLIDGRTTINLTSKARGTNYSSSNLSIANFGATDGQVFAGSDGVATITVTNNGFTATANVTVSTFAPTALSFIAIPGFANNVDVSGDFAYVAAGSAGLQVVDVTDRRAPRIVGALDTPGNAEDVRVVGQRAYVADGPGGLRIIDVSNPAAPALLGALDTSGNAKDVFVVGDRAYVADGAAGLKIINVSNPQSHVLLGAFDTPGTANGVEVSGNVAVVADENSLFTINVTNPASPSALGSVSMFEAKDLTVEGNTAYVADFSGSLRVVNIGTPATPTVLGSTAQSLGGILTDVAKSREFVFGADVLFVNGVPIVNVSTPASPVVRARLDFPARDDNGTGIAVDSTFVYLTVDQSGQESGVNGNSRLYIGQYLSLEDKAGVPPTVTITSPTAGSTVIEGATVQVKVTATDDVLVAGVSFLLNGQVVATDTSAPYEANVTIPTGVTSLTLGATAIDLSSNVGQADNTTLSVAPNRPPTVQIVSPSPGARVIRGSSLTVTAEASDDEAVSSVTFLVNGQQAFTKTSAPYTYTFTAPTTGSTLILGATAVDAAGKVGQAADVTVNLIPDPLTTVVGRVLNAGQPVAGANVVVLGSFTANTAGDGTFSIAGVPTIRGDLVATATFTQVNGNVFVGASNPFAPVRGGTTNVGDILVSESRRLLISEFRFRGLSGGLDEFVELYNNSDMPITVADSAGGAGYAVVGTNTTGTFSNRCTVPNGTVIPARGHFLCTNNGEAGYSLSGYATGDATYATGIVDNGGVALFSTTTSANWSTSTRLDAVGFAGITGTTLFTEGEPLNAILPFDIDHSFVRKTTASGLPQDTDVNAADFIFVDTNGTSAGAGQRLGAPGPENLASPVKGVVLGTPGISFGPLDPAVSASAAPNLVRDFTSDPANNATFGRLTLRMKLTNNTGQNITRLRFRINDLTTFPASAGASDLRPITVGATVVTSTGNANVNVQGTTLEQPPSQLNGGGFNSSLSAGTVTLGAPLAPGATINVQFVLGIQQTGAYRLTLNIETLPLVGSETIIFTGQTN